MKLEGGTWKTITWIGSFTLILILGFMGSFFLNIIGIMLIIRNGGQL